MQNMHFNKVKTHLRTIRNNSHSTGFHSFCNLLHLKEYCQPFSLISICELTSLPTQDKGTGIISLLYQTLGFQFITELGPCGQVLKLESCHQLNRDSLNFTSLPSQQGPSVDKREIPFQVQKRGQPNIHSRPTGPVFH